MNQTILTLSLFILFIQNSVGQTVDVLVDLPGDPSRFFLNENILYFTMLQNNYLYTADLSEDPVTATPIIEMPGDAISMALNGNDLYVSASITNKIYKIDITNDDLTSIDIGLSFETPPNGLVLYGDVLYVSESITNTIFKIDLTQTTLTKETVIENNGLSFPNEMFINGNDLYISNVGGDNILKLDLTNTSPEPEVVVSLNNPASVEIVGNYIYVPQILDGKISKVDLSTTPPTITEVATDLDGPVDIIPYEDDLYIAENYGQKISKIQDFTLSVNDQNIQSTIVLYPNPSSNFIFISNITEETDYVIFDILGKKINQGSLSINQNIDITNLVTGTYLIRVGHNTVKQFIKQ